MSKKVVLITDSGYEHETIIAGILVEYNVNVGKLLTEFENFIGDRPEVVPWPSRDSKKRKEAGIKLKRRLVKLGFLSKQDKYANKSLTAAEYLVAFVSWLEIEKKIYTVPVETEGYYESYFN